VPAGKRDVALVGIFDHLDASRLHDGERPIELIGLHHEGVMVGVLTGLVRIDVVRYLGEHKITVAALHE
jgi:hypothetical protein